MRAISLFSGAGGMDVGFSKAGFNIFIANENDKYACQTYCHNHPSSEMVEADLQDKVDKFIGLEEVDLVFGGPPCQGFSVAGKMDPNDHRSKLIFEFAKVVDQVQPRAFVMENVKSLGTLSKFSEVREKLVRDFTEMGYTVSMHILNSKSFGVPQSRERVFFIGLLGSKRLLRDEDFTKYERVPPSLREAIEHLGPAGSATNSRVCKAKITMAAKPVMRRSPYAGMLFNGQGRPLNPDGWASTLPATMGGNRTPIVDEKHLYKFAEPWVERYHEHLSRGGKPYDMHAAPSYLRRLTIDEAKLLQGFPDEYEFFGPLSKVFSQIGNAVPCQLAEVVGQLVFCELTKSVPAERKIKYQDQDNAVRRSA